MAQVHASPTTVVSGVATVVPSWGAATNRSVALACEQFGDLKGNVPFYARVLVAICLGLFAQSSARAQPRVEAAGSVVDADGLALPGVAVTLSTSEGRAVPSGFTDAAGAFRLEADPGVYQLAVTLEGFRRYEAPVDLPRSRSDRRCGPTQR